MENKDSTKKQMIINEITSQDIKNVYRNSFIDWEIFRNKTFYITGSTGIIGSFLIRCLRNANNYYGLNLKIVAGVRDIKKAITFFNIEKPVTNNFELTKCDVTKQIHYKGNIDYIIYCAGNTSSKSFVDYPAETFIVAVKGTENILNLAKNKQVKSVL